MLVNISDPILQTLFFEILLFAAIILTTKKIATDYTLTKSHTYELKGVALLMVIFSHTGYFLASDTRFLFPLSVFAGVGVNLFLFLSGFGLLTSQLSVKLSPLAFYRKRFAGIYLPMWVIISILFILDLVLLNKTYPIPDIYRSYFGYFPIADIYTSFNSPLWYFTFIIFYYVVFPLVYLRRAPLLSVVAIYLLSNFVVHSKLPVSSDILKLYQLHILAFPFGMLWALLNNKLSKSPMSENFDQKLGRAGSVIRLLLILIFSYIFCYTAINSGVGKSIKTEQFFSLITMLALLGAFVLKKYQSGFLTLLGVYSYEIYLIQWPIMYRYDFLYKKLPASLATFAYLLFFILIAYFIKKFEIIIKKMVGYEVASSK